MAAKQSRATPAAPGLLRASGPRNDERTAAPRADWLAGLAFLVVIGTITLAPVLYVVAESFDVAPLGAPFRFGLDGWSDLASSPRTASAIVYSFILALRVPIAIAAALVISWLLIRVEVPGRRFIELTLLFGFFLPSVPMMMGWILLLDSNYGLLNVIAQKLPFVTGPIFSIYSVPGIMWVHLSLTTVPIMVILLTPALRQFDTAYEEAAEMAGAGPFAVWRKVTLPLLAPAIITALIAGLIRSLETFEVEQLLGVPANIYVYATRIFDMIAHEPPLFPQALALSTVFLAILFLLAGVFQIYLRRAGARPTLTGKGVRLKARPRAWAWLASLLLLAYVSFSILLPLAVLIAGSFNKLFGFFFIDEAWTASHWLDVLAQDSFLAAAINSVMLGCAVGLIGVVLFAIAAWAIVRSRLWSRGIVSFLVWLPWAIPGLVLGVTLLSLILNVPGLNRLYGTLAPLVLALIVKELPIGVQMIRAAIAQVAPELEEAGRMAGAPFIPTFRRITLRLVAPTLVSVFLLVFGSTIRDISTVVLVAAPGSRTLSLLMFEFAGSGRFEQAAVLGVIIALIALAVSAVAFRLGNRQGIGL
jgi:iron(III) transport system permease protein